jgi:uncharacterized protein
VTSRAEEEYFFQEEVKNLKRLAEERQKQKAAEQLAQEKALHWMHCPKCGHKLNTIRYVDVEIDRCFACGGVWLDDGELEKVVAYGRDADDKSLFDRVLAVFGR